MRKLVILLVLAAAVGAGLWSMLGGPAADETVASGRTETEVVTRVERGERATAEKEMAEREGRGFGVGEARARRLRAATEARAEVQRRIVEGLERRVAAGAEAKGAKVETEEAAPAGNLVDQTGEHAYLLRVMNEELMPLADECVAMARERGAAVVGLLAVDVNLVGDAEVGGVVEEVAASQVNEVRDAELLECVRESLMAVTLPPPPAGGRDEFMLSMPLTPE